MTTATAPRNRILPPTSQFSAMVDGKPTGLAGCTQAAQCPRAARCLRADERLRSRFDLCNGQPQACTMLIPND